MHTMNAPWQFVRHSGEPRSGIVFLDAEVGVGDRRVHDIGAVRIDGSVLHSSDPARLLEFIGEASVICGHNIIHHDLHFLSSLLSEKSFTFIDTLYWSPLLFPEKPYHALLKDDKILQDEFNNPASDAKKAMQLYLDEVSAFSKLTERRKSIYCALLSGQKEFEGFLKINAREVHPLASIEGAIMDEFDGRVCSHAKVRAIVHKYPVELAYALALIGTADKESITPPWVAKNYPKVESIINHLCNTPCPEGCSYCKDRLDVRKNLRCFFGFEKFRTYEGEPLQENAARAAVEGRSLIAVFPTGGGKSVTFQLPALMAGDSVRGLTVVISPLQSLMKDQVDNLCEKGITGAVTVNGLLNPIERAEAFRRTEDGSACLIYISPEQLRSRTVENVLLHRNVVRFVVDEAHCFSAWGQDFRVDYLYIGEFIKKYQEVKNVPNPIPVSCFTATAKQKVVSDIRDYFKNWLGVELAVFASTANRKNLHYAVLHKETDADKYVSLRALIESRTCPTIVYVSRTRRTTELAQKLVDDGFAALPFNGKMDPEEKIANQNAFMRNEARIMVATSAFGMGVDKKDIGLVIHYDISDSLENYVQEAGRAGRDPSLEAECYVLYSDDDLDKHFIMLNQTKLSLSDIQLVWRAIKRLSPTGRPFCTSALELARAAGWDDSVVDTETRIRTAIAALENAGYVKRGQNMPRVYATGIRAANMVEAVAKINASKRMNEQQRMNATRVVKSLISARSVSKAGNDDAESRVDYLADMLGLERRDVVEAINAMREDGLLADTQDMTASIGSDDTPNKTIARLLRFVKIEEFVISKFAEGKGVLNLREINDELSAGAGYASGVGNIKTLIRFWAAKGLVEKSERPGSDYVKVAPSIPLDKMKEHCRRRNYIARFVVNRLYEKARLSESEEEGPCDFNSGYRAVAFSLVGMKDDFNSEVRLDFGERAASTDEVSDALLFLTRIGAMRLEGGFLVLYNGMRLQRLVKDNKRLYRKDDYRQLDAYYALKTQQIHIVGEFANLMVRDYDAALKFVNDYFWMDYGKFISKYYAGEKSKIIGQSITAAKRKRLFASLSMVQTAVMSDDKSRVIVIAAGPGSGKTLVLVHKLASLILLEDVKPERLLMLTFSRAAAIVFKKRLADLIGGAAHFVEIKTFHSYCFDLVGKVGCLEYSDKVVSAAVDMIKKGEVEPTRIAKTALVIDEAQDMDLDAYHLVRALMEANDSMRVIAVGDDDQNIFGFRGSDSENLRRLASEPGSNLYDMVENFRSAALIVATANRFVSTIGRRMKTVPLRPAQGADEGSVRLVLHDGTGFESAVVEDCASDHVAGTSCVMAWTNEQALRVFSRLRESGISAKLVQSNEGFRLADLAEIRYFRHLAENDKDSVIIDDDKWKDARDRFCSRYAGSSCLDGCLAIIDAFASSVKKKYKSDFSDFLMESRYEDFIASERGVVMVSTIHKSKGREYDSVYMMLDGIGRLDDAARRAIYVGMTRAKKALRIHLADRVLMEEMWVDGVEIVNAGADSGEPGNVIVQLSHKDVVLDFFKDKKRLICDMRSGDRLVVDGVYLLADVNGDKMRIVKFSKGFQEKLSELTAKGYRADDARIRFVVAWKGADDIEESAVILPEIYFSRHFASRDEC